MWPNAEVLATCAEYRVAISAPDVESIVGVATSFDSNDLPINGLRHPNTDGTCGWFFWSGEIFPTQDDAFKPMCLRHLIERGFPGLRFLGLPPGWRFLVTGEYVDVWYDESLLEIA